MFKASIEVGIPLYAGHKDSDVCARQVKVTIILHAISSAPKVMDIFDPKNCTDESLDALMRQIVKTLKDYGAIADWGVK